MKDLLYCFRLTNANLLFKNKNLYLKQELNSYKIKAVDMLAIIQLYR